MVESPAIFVALLLLAVAVTVAVLVRSRTRRGAPLAVGVGGFAAAPPPSVARTRVWVVAQLVVGVLVCVFGVLSFLNYHQRSTLEQLYADASAHRLHDVSLSPGLPAGAEGSVERRVTWRTGISQWEVLLVQQRGSGSSSYRGPESPEFTSDDVDARLRQLDPRVRLETGPAPSDSGSVLSVAGLPRDGVFGLTASVVSAAGFLLILTTLIGGPEPWRATRWAWFWLLATPMGWLAFCAFSGPTPRLAPPSRSRRMTGGPAFILGLVLNSVYKPALRHLASLVLPGHG